MKVLIIGIVASGKSTLSKRLSSMYNIDRYEIDEVVYDTSNNKRSIEEQEKIFKKINKNKDWIIEGVLRKHLDYLLEWSDKIIILDIPIRVRKYRIIKRYIKQKLGIEKSGYKPSINMVKNMFKWTKEFDYDELIKRCSKYRDKVIVLNKVSDINKYSL